MKLFKSPETRKRILFSLFIIVVFRALAHIPVPGIDISAVRAFLQNSVFFGFFDLFSGGGFQNFSLVTLGLGPYINISIIIQLLTFVIPSLEELSKEGETGREQINRYTKIFSVPMAMFQAYGIYFLLNKQQVIGQLNVFDLFVLMCSLTAGSLLLVWLGDLVTEYGIGNGISLLIFVGIISRLPVSIAGFFGTLDSSNFFSNLIFIGASLLVIAGVVLVNEGTRNIVMEYGRRGLHSQKVANYLPIKVNQAGVIPIIFAVSVVMLPSLIGGPLQSMDIPLLRSIGSFLVLNFNSQSLGYNVLFFVLVVGFTYLYTFIQFSPDKIADDLKKRGGFIPGIRPGKGTTDYLRGVMSRITLFGALFLGIIAILPYIVQVFLGVNNLGIGGTGLLIVVSVVLETIRQLQSLNVTKSYENYLR